MTIEDTATETEEAVGVFSGVEILDSCSEGKGSIEVKPNPYEFSLWLFGTTTLGENAPKEIRHKEALGWGTIAAVADWSVTARNTAGVGTYVRLDLQMEGCSLAGMVTPSITG